MGLIFSDIEGRWNVRAVIYDLETGHIIGERRTHNIVTDTGLTEIARRIALIAPAGEDKFSVGEGTTEPEATDTEMEAPLFTGNISRAKGGTKSALLSFVLPNNAIVGEDISEVGILTWDNDLIARAVLSSPITVEANKGIAFQWTWTLANVED